MVLLSLVLKFGIYIYIYIEREMDFLSWVWSAAPMVAMITVECTDVGLSTLCKEAITKGMSNLVFIVYYNALGTIILLPFVFRRKRPPFTFSVVCRFILISLIGSLAQILALLGLKYSSPTLVSAMNNLVPIFTFMLAIIFRMEKLDIKSSTGIAISLGALVSVSGALIISLYKGPPILLHSQHSSWAIGGLILSITCFCSAIYNIYTAATVKVFPDKTTIVFFYCFFNTILCGIFVLFVERNPNSWKLSSQIEMIAIFYAATLGLVFRIGVHTWCLQDKGPIYVAMFRPLGISIAVFMGVMFLGETLHIGSVIGAFIVTAGFYTVMWGKSKEQNLILNSGADDDLDSNSQREPFLQNNPKEEMNI
ncbi:hypothetical protein LguiB_011306 [Lonicera macranthoides]